MAQGMPQQGYAPPQGMQQQGYPAQDAQQSFGAPAAAQQSYGAPQGQGGFQQGGQTGFDGQGGSAGAAPANGKVQGTVKKWFEEKGFGFVTTSDGSDVFVHHSAVKAEGRASLEIGESVEFNIITGDDGRSKAADLTGPNGAFVKGMSQSFGGGGYGGGGGGYGGGGGGYGGGGYNQGGGGGGYGGGGRGGGGGYGGGGYGGGGRGGGGGGGGGGVCFSYRDHGSCKFGDNCRYSHSG